MIAVGSNPVISKMSFIRMPHSGKRFKALIARHADYILPGSHWLERADFPVTFNTLMGTTPIPYHQYTDPVLPLKGKAKQKTWIFLELCRHASVSLGGSRVLQGMFSLGRILKKIPLVGKALPEHTQFILGMINRISGHGGFIGQRVITPDGKINLAPQEFCTQVPTLEADFTRELASAGPLKLISKRERFSHNTWTHNHASFVHGKNDRNYLNINTTDALSRDGLDSLEPVSGMAQLNGILVDVSAIHEGQE